MLTMEKPSSSRNSSRLSHISSLRHSFNQPKTQTTLGRHDDKSNTSLVRTKSNHSMNSNLSGYMDNYKLSRVESQESALSALSVQCRYKITLKLNAKEISLLRYTWEKMLVEAAEPEEPTTSALPLPGSLWSEAKEKPLPRVSASRRAYGATSTFCSQLYSNLLSMEPGLIQAFPSLKHQAVSMAGVLSLAINSLENLSTLDAYLSELGNRHSRILGIEPSQFELMGEAFIKTFHERFGTRFTHELEILWIKFYMYLANSLLQFGIDPVMRYDASPQANQNHFADSFFTAETDQNSMVFSTRRMSESTEFSSVASEAKPVERTARTKAGQTPVAPATGARSQKDARTKKRTRLGRAKGDCSIM